MKTTALILVVMVAAAFAAPQWFPFSPVNEALQQQKILVKRGVTYLDGSGHQRDTVVVVPQQPQTQRTGAFAGANDAWKVAVTGALDFFTAGKPSK